MSMQRQIEAKLRQALNPNTLDVINESHLHNVPPGSESHFKAVIVSEQFAGKRLVARHRMVNEVLAAELTGGIHALALHTLTPEEYKQKQGAIADSPLCMGGSKAS